MKFLVDMPLSPQLAIWMRDKEHDAVHAHEVGLAIASDEAILRRAQIERRVVVTADLDFPRLLALTQADRPGPILFRGENYRENSASVPITFDLPKNGKPTSLMKRPIVCWEIEVKYNEDEDDDTTPQGMFVPVY